MFYKKVGSRDAESKNAKGGITAIRHGRTFVPIHNAYYGGTIIVYELIKAYFAARNLAHITGELLFVDMKTGK